MRASVLIEAAYQHLHVAKSKPVEFRRTALRGMLSEEAENGEGKEEDPDTLEHTDDRQAGEHKEKTEAGKAQADQMEEEQFEESSEAESIDGLVHQVDRDTSAVPAIDPVDVRPAIQRSGGIFWAADAACDSLSATRTGRRVQPVPVFATPRFPRV